MRFLKILLLPALVAALAPVAASAAPRMFVGFQDDPSFRWRTDRASVLDDVAKTNSSIVKTSVYWFAIAPKRPRRATNPFDKGYYFADLDEFVRGANQRGLDVLLQIWGTPGWANGNKGKNHLPTRLADLQNFAKAVALRYSGRYAGYPQVRMYAVWNESNLEQFLAPQYDAKGKPVGPANYAKLYRAAYAGIKAGNKNALVAIGETSARGRDKSLYVGKKHGGSQETESPGRFAELLSKTKPALKFDAWGQHPYPTRGDLPPTQKVKWPNVTLTQLPRFERSLDKWFKRKNIPIWITEYGHQTRPGKAGVSTTTQAKYVREAIKMAAKDPRVQMFIWFVFRDDPTSAWQSGVFTRAGKKKPALAAFTNTAKLYDERNPIVKVKAGSSRVTVRIPALEFVTRSGIGKTVRVTYTVTSGKSALDADQQLVTKLGRDGYLTLRIPLRTQKKRTYTIDLSAFDIYNNVVDRKATVVAA